MRQGQVVSLLDFLLPQVCVLCEAAQGPLCAGCAGRLPWLRPPVCVRCGVPIDPSRGVACTTCADHPPSYAQARAVLTYEGDAVRIVHALKYKGVHSLAATLAESAVGQWPGLFSGVTSVTFVPLTRRRRAQRGYNQAEVFARAVAARLALPCRPWLVQERLTQDQVGLAAADRRANVTGAYHVMVAASQPKSGHGDRSGAGSPSGCGLASEVPSALAADAGCGILLVDDVLTTGATAEVCAELLRQAGWPRVQVLTIARVARRAARSLGAAARPEGFACTVG